MEALKIKDIGEAIRRVRKTKGLRLEDLADDGISTATISNIERGVAHAHTSKVYYLMEKLGLSMEQIPEILMGQEEELKELKFRLTSIEAMIDLEKPRDAVSQLNQIDLEDHHPYAALVQYIRGKAFRVMKKWKRAEKSFSSAIVLSKQNNDKENMEAVSFLELSLCCYLQNNMDKALDFANSGLKAFDQEGERRYVKYALLRNKIIFLERLGRVVEGLKVIQDVWDQIDEIKDMETVLTLYSTRADLLRKTGMMDEAIHYAEEGLELARINKHYSCMFDMWTILGSVYTSKGRWERAEQCFHTALASKHLIQNGMVLTDAYVWLGILNVQQKKWDQAKESLQQAIANAEKHDDAPKLIYALRVMGDFWKEQDNKQEAIPYYERALQIAQKFHYKPAEKKLHFRLSQCYKDRDQKEFERSLLKMYETQMELKRGAGDILEEE